MECESEIGLASPAVVNPVTVGVLLLHGLTGTPTEMTPLARYLTKRGWKVEVPMLAGHGASQQELQATSCDDWLESARASLRKLAGQCDSIFVGGICMGAMLSLLLSVEEPKVKGTILISVDAGYPARHAASPFRHLMPLAYHFPFWLQKRFYWTERPPYGVRDQAIQDEITYALEQARSSDSQDFGNFRTYVPSFKQLARLRQRASQALSKATAATLVLHSREDSLMDVKNAEIVYAKLGCLQKELKLYEGCDHMLPIDLKRREVFRDIEMFISKVAGKGSPA